MVASFAEETNMIQGPWLCIKQHCCNKLCACFFSSFFEKFRCVLGLQKGFAGGLAYQLLKVRAYVFLRAE